MLGPGRRERRGRPDLTPVLALVDDPLTLCEARKPLAALEGRALEPGAGRIGFAVGAAIIVLVRGATPGLEVEVEGTFLARLCLGAGWVTLREALNRSDPVGFAGGSWAPGGGR